MTIPFACPKRYFTARFPRLYCSELCNVKKTRSNPIKVNTFKCHWLCVYLWRRNQPYTFPIETNGTWKKYFISDGRLPWLWAYSVKTDYLSKYIYFLLTCSFETRRVRHWNLLELEPSKLLQCFAPSFWAGVLLFKESSNSRFLFQLSDGHCGGVWDIHREEVLGLLLPFLISSQIIL